MSLLELEGFQVDVITDARSVSLVRELDLTLESGETLCIVGESGSGKTVTAMSIIRLLEYLAIVETRGEVRLDGVDLTSLTPEQMRGYRGRRIGMVFQEALDSLNPSQRIGRQLIEAYRPGDEARAGEGAVERATQLLTEVGLSDTERIMGLYPHQLSGGMQQRVMIAMALMSSPDLLLADEPTTALDVTTQAEILKLFRKVQREHRMGCIFITHDMGVAAEIADRIAVFYAGRLVELGTTRQILTSPRHRYTRALMTCVPQVGVRRSDGLPSIPGSVPAPGDQLNGCRFAARCRHVLPACTTAAPPLASADGGSQAACWNPGSGPVSLGTATARVEAPEPVRSDAPLVQIEGVTRAFHSRTGPKGFGGIRRRETLLAVNDVSLQLAPGEFFGLVGESGSGKTTLGQLVAALDDPTAGSIRVGDHVHSPKGLGGAGRPFRRQVQLIFQDPQSSLDPRHSIGRIIAEPLRELTDLRGEALRARVRALIDEVGLPASLLGKLPSQISGGQRQRVAIARAIAPEPSLIVADEPTSALDVSVQGQVMNLLLQLRRERRLSYLFITHNLSLVLSIADRVGVMKQGRIIEIASPDEIVAHPQHDYTRTLLAANPGLPQVAG